MLGTRAPAEAIPIPRKWDQEFDVVCVGYGGAGAATAITAHDAGAKVLIVEKMAKGGGNTAVSAGGVLCPTNVEDAHRYITELYRFSNSDMDADLVRLYAEMSVQNVEWLKGLREGIDVLIYGGAGYSEVPGAKAMQKYQIKGEGKGMAGASKNLWALYRHAVEEKRKIPVMLDSPAERLITNEKGEVIGLFVTSGGKRVAIRAKRAVVLTTGGFEYNQNMHKNYLKGFPVHALGNPGNTGDGIRMAQAVGADLWHMNGASCPLGIKVREFEGAFPFVASAPAFILVDKHGRRFVNEKAIELHAGLLAVDHFDTHTLEYPRIPCYAIFDETAREAGPFTSLAGMSYAGRQHTWSKDNRTEIDKGWILQGGTLRELASKIKTIDPAVFEQAVARWNEDMKKGEDSQFHRPLRSTAKGNVAYKELATTLWSAPLERPPFYAVELHPCLLNTQGGPRRNTKAQVLDAFGNPIPRLYSAGEIGSMWGIIYQGAGNNAESIIFGRIAGKNAAAESPWA